MRACTLALALLMPLAAADVDVIRERMVADLVAPPQDLHRVQGWAESLRGDGSWGDVAYADQERSGWRTVAHLDRTLGMARAGRQAEGEVAAGLVSASVRGLAHWVDRDYQNPNWWHNQIGVPWKVGDLLLILGADVPGDLRRRAITTILTRAKIGMTGQNTVWLAGNTVRRALLQDDGDLLTKALETIFAEIRVSTDEGVQPDASFHQHGPQLQWGNYGLAFISDHCQWARLVAGTRYALDAQRLAILRTYLFDGLVWSVWRGAMDTACMGRQFSPGSQHGKGRAVLRALAAWARVDADDTARVAEMTAALNGSGPNMLIGNRHFWRSDVTIQRTVDWQATLKLCSTRVVGAERVNEENKRGRYLGQGLLSILQDGDEYEDIYPLWDWARLPGTTTAVGSDPDLPTDWKKSLGPEAFVGGASDGVCAIIGQAYVESLERKVRGRRAWFFHPGGVVCLGADFRGPESTLLVTTIEQCLAQGPVHLGLTGAGDVGGVMDQVVETDLVWHRDRAYAFFAPTALAVKVEGRVGDWKTVRPTAGSAQGRVFQVDLTHGPGPSAYAYQILPRCADPDEARTRAASMRILANTPEVQAVAAADGDLIAIVFHQGGVLDTPAGRVGLDQAGAVILRRDAEGVWRIHVADPTQRLRQVVLSRDGAAATVALPQGGLAGSTVSVP